MIEPEKPDYLLLLVQLTFIATVAASVLTPLLEGLLRHG